MSGDAPYFGPITRRLLDVRDAKLRRCWWCGAFAWHQDDCAECSAPHSKPETWEQTA